MQFRLFSVLSLMCMNLCSIALANIPEGILVLRGTEIAPHIQEIAHFSNLIYSEYPYYYDGKDADYQSYLESYASSNDAVVCLAYDRDELVGLAAGVPMQQARECYQAPFIERGVALDNLFYLGEFVLHFDYCIECVGSEMLTEIEKHVAEKGNFDAIFVWEIDETTLTAERPPGYLSKTDFWKGHGFAEHPDLGFTHSWTHIGETESTPHDAIYWSKTL